MVVPARFFTPFGNNRRAGNLFFLLSLMKIFPHSNFVNYMSEFEKLICNRSKQADKLVTNLLLNALTELLLELSTLFFSRKGMLMKYFALLFAVIVFCCCGTASAQYTEPGSGGGGTYTEPGTGGGGGDEVYTEPENPKENNWIATAWGSCSGTALIRTGTSMIK
jgi:hypothetical protein